jgi:hypothetical protein
MTPLPRPARLTAAAMALLAIGFNLPYARLAATFDYPGILREPVPVILAAFTVGGPALVATWYAFALAAILFAPVAVAHAVALGRLRRWPERAAAAALAGALAGTLQAIGLLRWITAVPALAAAQDPEAALAALHAWGGIGIGEHLGQIATAMHVGLMAAILAAEGRRALATGGTLTAVLIGVGAFEGVALALGAPGGAFAAAAIAGYLALTLWMLGAAWALIRPPRMAPGAAGA